MSTARTSGRAAVAFTLAGVPVEVHVSVVVLLGLLGLSIGDPLYIAVWVVVGLTSLLLHELGHAAAARFAGASPRIELAGLGGVTRYDATARLRSRGWRLAVALAGPAAGLGVWLVARQLRTTWAPVDALPATALGYVEFTSLVWSLFNLLPILPLDGGQALAQLLPGDERTRVRRAAGIGVAVGVAIVLGALYLQLAFVAVFLAFTTWRNIQLLRATGRVDPVRAAVRARDWPTVRGLLLAGEGSPELARQAVREAAAEEQHRTAVELAELCADRDWDDVRTAWQAARSWVALGEPDRALPLVSRAVALGAPPDALAGDPELAEARALPGWPTPPPAGG